MTLLGPPRARLQQAGTFAAHVSVHRRRITGAVAGGGGRDKEEADSRLPGTYPPTHIHELSWLFVCFFWDRAPGAWSRPSATTITAGAVSNPGGFRFAPVRRSMSQEPLRLAAIRLTDMVIDPTRGVGWSQKPGYRLWAGRVIGRIVISGRARQTSGGAGDNLGGPPKIAGRCHIRYTVAPDCHKVLHAFPLIR